MVSMPCRNGRTAARSGTFHGSQKVDYGLYVLATLACADVPYSTRAIANAGGLSFSFVQKVAYLMKRAGLVCAVRGKEGGYVLARKPQRITVKDVIEAVDGRTAVFVCAVRSRVRTACPRKNFCALRKSIDIAHQESVQSYLSKKLTDFIA